MADALEVRIRDLERRMDTLEGQFGLLTRQLTDLGRSILAVHETVEDRFDTMGGHLERSFATIGNRFDRVDEKLDAIPDLIAKLA